MIVIQIISMFFLFFALSFGFIAKGWVHNTVDLCLTLIICKMAAVSIVLEVTLLLKRFNKD